MVQVEPGGNPIRAAGCTNYLVDCALHIVVRRLAGVTERACEVCKANDHNIKAINGGDLLGVGHRRRGLDHRRHQRFLEARAARITHDLHRCARGRPILDVRKLDAADPAVKVARDEPRVIRPWT